jgi:hypothetical protein
MVNEKNLIAMPMWRLKTLRLPQCFSLLPTFHLFPFFVPPLDLAIKILLVTILCDPLIKNGVINGNPL